MSKTEIDLGVYKAELQKGFSNAHALQIANGEGRKAMAGMVSQMDDIAVFNYVHTNVSIAVGDATDAQNFVYFLQEACSAEHLHAATINEVIDCLRSNKQANELFSHLITQDVITEAMELAAYNPSCQNESFWAKLTSKICENEASNGSAQYHDDDDLQMFVLRLLDDPSIDEKYPFWKSYTKSLHDQGHIFLSGPALSKLNASDAHAPSTSL